MKDNFFSSIVLLISLLSIGSMECYTAAPTRATLVYISGDAKDEFGSPLAGVLMTLEANSNSNGTGTVYVSGTAFTASDGSYNVSIDTMLIPQNRTSYVFLKAGTGTSSPGYTGVFQFSGDGNGWTDFPSIGQFYGVAYEGTFGDYGPAYVKYRTQCKLTLAGNIYDYHSSAFDYDPTNYPELSVIAYVKDSGGNIISSYHPVISSNNGSYTATHYGCGGYLKVRGTVNRKPLSWLGDHDEYEVLVYAYNQTQTDAFIYSW